MASKPTKKRLSENLTIMNDSSFCLHLGIFPLYKKFKIDSYEKVIFNHFNDSLDRNILRPD
jgi:hypothetical protein